MTVVVQQDQKYLLPHPVHPPCLKKEKEVKRVLEDLRISAFNNSTFHKSDGLTSSTGSVSSTKSPMDIRSPLSARTPWFPNTVSPNPDTNGSFPQ